MGNIKQKSAFKHAQNMQIQIILLIRKVSSRSLLSSGIFCTIQLFC